MNHDNPISDDTDTGVGRLAEMIANHRRNLGRKLSGEGTSKAQAQDLVEVLAHTIAFASAIELILSRAEGAAPGQLPGHKVSVRNLVDQVLSGEARETSRRRLHKWTQDAIIQLEVTHQCLDVKLREFARKIADTFNPDRISGRVKVGLWGRLTGSNQRACWEEYGRCWQDLDSHGVIDIATKYKREGS